MIINKEIRQDIIDTITLTNGSWHGELDDVTFLERLFDLDKLPSYDYRYTTSREDIDKHRIINPDDWPLM
jgi:hypothetical protein